MGDTLSGFRGRTERLTSSRRGGGDPPSAPMAGGAGPPVLWSRDQRLSQLERLAALRDAGALTEVEFASEKAILLSTKER
jgi:hypothetical protein